MSSSTATYRLLLTTAKLWSASMERTGFPPLGTWGFRRLVPWTLWHSSTRQIISQLTLPLLKACGLFIVKIAVGVHNQDLLGTPREAWALSQAFGQLQQRPRSCPRARWRGGHSWEARTLPWLQRAPRMYRALEDALSLKKTSAWQAEQIISWAGGGEAASFRKTGVSSVAGCTPENAVPDGALGGGWLSAAKTSLELGPPEAPPGPTANPEDASPALRHPLPTRGCVQAPWRAALRAPDPMSLLARLSPSI